jgi:predicted enzyme related to lactoylglutathione lyase
MSTNDRKLGLVLDSRDPQRLAPFWAAALGYQVVVDVDNYVLLMPVDQGGPKLLLQKVPEDKVVKNRMHMDIETPDIETAADELVEMGATRVGPVVKEHGTSWVVMNDPDGNEFCVCDGGAASA